MRTDSDSASGLSLLAVRAIVLVASFSYALTWFLAILERLELPPTSPSAVGLVTLQGHSKAEDYAAALIFIVVVAGGTIAFEALARRLFRRLTVPPFDSETDALLQSLCLALPFLLAPLLHVTTRHEGWALLLPPALAIGALAAIRSWLRRDVVHRLVRGDLVDALAIFVATGSGWIVFRYLSTGRRLAPSPSVTLEIILVALFLCLTIATSLMLVRLLVLLAGWNERRAVAAVAIGSLPLLALPLAALWNIPPQVPLLAALLTGGVLFLIARASSDVHDRIPALRTGVSSIFWPVLIFVFGYATTYATTDWVDLFHRGETLGPASDYLRGKIPYGDVLPIHGMLENGLLDAWLMSILGRDASVAIGRIVVVGSLSLPLIYAIAMVIFRSVPLALLTVLLSTFTFVDNHRLALHLGVVLLVIAWLRGGRLAWLVAAGLVSGLTLFYSVDIGLYATAGSVATLILLGFCVRIGYLERAPASPWKGLIAFAAGLVAAAVPFLLWLGHHGVAGTFLEVSFITVPSIIDAVWSIPYPDLFGGLGDDFSLRAISELVLGEKIRFILNPLVLVVAVIALARRGALRRSTAEDAALLALVVAALLAQRSALGRADFQHQYFAAYLLPPVMMILAVRGWRALAAATRGSAELPFRILLVSVVLAVAGIALWVPDLLNARLDAITAYRSRVSGTAVSSEQAAEVRRRVALFQQTVRGHGAGDEPMFDFSNQPALYFYADRPNPTRFYQVPILSPANFQMEAIAAIEAARAPLVVRGSPEGFDRFDGIPNEVRAPALAAYIDDHYEPWRSADGIEIWQRRATAPRDLREYEPLARFKRPLPGGEW